MPKGLQRLPVDIEELRKNIETGKIKDIKILPDEGESLLTRYFAIAGPLDTPYEGFWFRTEVIFSTQYPFRPPKVKMLDKIWNPFFDQKTGEICIDILYTQWSPIFSPTRLLLSIISVLSERQINLEESTFLNPQAAILMDKNQPLFKKEARKFCHQNCYKIQQIYDDTLREAPREEAIKAEGEILQEFLEAEKKEETLKKRKLIQKEKMEKQKQRREDLCDQKSQQKKEQELEEDFPSLLKQPSNQSNSNPLP